MRRPPQPAPGLLLDRDLLPHGLAAGVLGRHLEGDLDPARLLGLELDLDDLCFAGHNRSDPPLRLDTLAVDLELDAGRGRITGVGDLDLEGGLLAPLDLSKAADLDLADLGIADRRIDGRVDCCINGEGAGGRGRILVSGCVFGSELCCMGAVAQAGEGLRRGAVGEGAAVDPALDLGCVAGRVTGEGEGGLICCDGARGAGVDLWCRVGWCRGDWCQRPPPRCSRAT